MFPAAEPVNVYDYERLAEEVLEPGAYGYFAGGAGDELTLRDNLAAFRRWQLRPRVLVDLSEATTDTTVLGAPVSMPLLVGPTAFQRLALGARAVPIARPFLWGLAVGGEAGVLRVLELLREEIRLALALTGCPSPDEVTRAHVQGAPR